MNVFDDYNEATVSQPVKILAFCFNTAAEKIMPGKLNSDILFFRNASSLYKAMTGSEAVNIELQNASDEACIRLAFIKVGAIQAAGDGGWSDFGQDTLQNAESLFEKASSTKQGPIFKRKA